MKMFNTLTARADVLKLRAAVLVLKGKKAKCPYVTQIVVYHGTLKLGAAVVGGRWSEAQALASFIKNPASFGFKEAVPGTVSFLYIDLGPVTVAQAIVKGVEHTPESALTMFKADPTAFEQREGFGAAQALGLVA